MYNRKCTWLSFALEILVITCSTLWKEGESLRILAFFPHPLMSHQSVYRPIVQALAKKGHNVTYFSCIRWNDHHPNVEHRRMLEDSDVGEKNNEVFNFSSETVKYGNSMWSIFNPYANEAAMRISQMLVKDPVVQDLIYSNETYDLIVTEALIGYEHFTAFAHKFNASSIVILPRGDSAWANEMSGFTDSASYMVDFKSPYGPSMPTKITRLHNALIMHTTRYYGYLYLKQSQDFVDKYFDYPGWEKRPPIKVLAQDHALILVNSHHSVGYAYPKAPHVKAIGGVSIQQPGKLPAHIKTFLDEAEHGVIYFSFGNHIDYSSPSMKPSLNVFFEVFENRKEQVLWQWTGKHLKKTTKNILFTKWIPQTDILAHNNTKLFICHGDLLSMMEAVHFAVPLVGILLGDDSRKNMKVATASGYAVDVEFNDVTVPVLSELIDEVLNNTRYKENAMKQSQLFRDRAMTPLKEAVYWIEYVARHGKVLQPASLHMPYLELYAWDVWCMMLLLVISVVLMIATIVGLVIASFVIRLRGKKKNENIPMEHKEKMT